MKDFDYFLVFIIAVCIFIACSGEKTLVRNKNGNLEYCVIGYSDCEYDSHRWGPCSLAPLGSNEEKACNSRQTNK